MGYIIGKVGQVVGLSTPTIVCLTWLFHSLLKMPGGTYLGYSRHLYRMSICCLHKLFFAGMISGHLLTFPVGDFVFPNFQLKMRLD